MDETVSVNSSGDSSGTSDDFELLDPTSPVGISFPIVRAPYGNACYTKPSSDATTDLSFSISSSSTVNMPKSAAEEPHLAIANNGNLDDLQKQMSEVCLRYFVVLWNFDFICLFLLSLKLFFITV